ncbi:MAG: hypothetical protein FJ026_10760 [Chloroflexi bacterium]|nr:hypothetical protein [Chloroflexota bacterium]
MIFKHLSKLFLSIVLTCLLLIQAATSSSVHPVFQADGWTQPTRLFAVPLGTRTIVGAIVSNRFGRLYALWNNMLLSGKGLGYEAIEYWISRWDGQSWSQPVSVLYAPFISTVRVVADDRNVFHIFYTGEANCLYYMALPDQEMLNPAAWSKARCIDDGGPTNVSAAIDTNTQAICVVRAEPGAIGLRTLCSQDYGVSWKPGSVISASSVVTEQALNASPALAFDGKGKLHLAWSPATPPNGYPLLGVLYSQSDDLGLHWSGPVELGEPSEGDVRIAILDRYVYVVWNGDAGKKGRYVRFSSDGGVTWSPREALVPPASGRGGLQDPPPVVVDNAGEVHVLLHNQDILTYRHKPLGIGEWSPPVQLYNPGEGELKGEIFSPMATIYGGNELRVIYALSGIGVFEQRLALNADYEQPLPTPSPEPVLSTPQKPTPVPISSPTRAIPLTPKVTASTDVPTAKPDQAAPLIFAILPVVILIGAVVLIRLARRLP